MEIKNNSSAFKSNTSKNEKINNKDLKAVKKQMNKKKLKLYFDKERGV